MSCLRKIMKNRKAFTMVELVFVIVVVGILSAVAIPKLAATRDDAEISRARTTIASLRNAISTERQKRILRGDFSDVNGSAALKLLEYGISSDWSLAGDTFTYTGSDGTCKFKLKNNLLKKDDNCSVEEFDHL